VAVTRLALDVLAQIVTRSARQQGVGDDNIGIDVAQPDDSGLTVGDADDLESFSRRIRSPIR